jgi:hypothetical protein
MAKWIYTVEGRNIGPVSAREVANAVLKGELDAEASVLGSKDNLWKRIKDIPEIADLIYKPAVRPLFDDDVGGELKDFLARDIDIEEYYPIFYNIPARKLLMLQIITLGLFQGYWFYKQWNYLRSSSKGRMGSYFMAKMYVILFTYEIFWKIETNKELLKVKRAPWSARTLASIWYLGPIAFFTFPIWVVFPQVGAFLALVIWTTLVLVPVQRYINECNEALNRPLSRPSFGYYAVIVIAMGSILVWIATQFIAY